MAAPEHGRQAVAKPKTVLQSRRSIQATPGLTSLAGPTGNMGTTLAHPNVASPSAILQLQRAAGNRAVNGIFAQTTNLRQTLATNQSPPQKPSRLKVSQPDDRWEQEAGQAAQRVVTAPEHARPLQPIGRMPANQQAVQRLIDPEGWKTKRTAHAQRAQYKLAEIDAALEAWHILPLTAGFEAFDGALKKLQTAISAWKVPTELEAPKQTTGRKKLVSSTDSDDDVEETTGGAPDIAKAVKWLGRTVDETLGDLGNILESEKKIKAWQEQPEKPAQPVENLRHHRVLKDQLSTWDRGWEELNKGKPVDPYTRLREQIAQVEKENETLYLKTLDTQERLQRQLMTWIAEGLEQKGDPLLKNTCELIKQGQIKALAVLPTHDSAERVAKAKHKLNKTAYFPNGMVHNQGYVWQDLGNNSNITFQPTSWGGGSTSNTAYIMPKVMEDKAWTWRVLKHEGQHLVDKHKANKEPWNTYKTEYRAYFYMGEKEIDEQPHEGKVEPSMTLAGWESYDLTPRQLVILKRYQKEYPKRYAKVMTDPGVRSKVAGYQNPDTHGFNKFNSARIETFYQALNEVDYLAEIKHHGETMIKEVSKGWMSPSCVNWMKHYRVAYEQTRDPAQAYAEADRLLAQDKLPALTDGDHNLTLRHSKEQYDAGVLESKTRLRERMKMLTGAVSKLLPEEKAFILQSGSYRKRIQAKLPPPEQAHLKEILNA